MKPLSRAPSIFLSLVLFLMEGVFCSAQDAIQMRFQPTYRGQPIAFDTSAFHTATGATITVSMLKFYLSDLVVTMADGEALSISETMLVDLGEGEEFDIPRKRHDKVTSVSFTVGVDSILNESGPREGALDPRNGMYWTWATGYIFLKLEGTLESPTTPRRVYEVHVGGYKAPYRNMIDVVLPVHQQLSSDTVSIDVAVDRFFDAEPAFDITRRPSITDARQASDVIDRLRRMFRVR